MSRFDFWQRWLLMAALGLVFFGLIIALFNDTGVLDLVFNDRIDPVFYNGDPGPQAREFRQWVYGVMGATVAGWGVFMAFIAQGPFKRREPWAWVCVAAGLSLWAVVDLAVSGYYQVWANVVLNVALVLLIALPLAFTRREFF